MSNGHGGYRRPAHPAPVSGPGAHSRRTDGQPIRDLPDAGYGEQASFQDSQRQAPLPGNPAPRQVSGGGAPAGPPVVPMGAPSGMPGQPVTNGAQYGPGAGPEALGQQSPDKLDAATFRKYLPILLTVANDPDAPKSTVALVRRLLSNS